ncbi:acyltransferase [Sphingorhabdus sp. IMCC26285]|jgi:fucose 4-O-acetylase-like acetyltransferase|uniref:Acyltransferase n=1 Tax=Sphingorhabdus profundilacus TaxID=2509718 RepID=A0A6I4LWQ2_9SPHN|nr:acyltransferase [Sphingorhabdus profundilacus]MVZ96573.1 acyltransferase [Sphingorhabdus profundilacus]
MNRIKWLDSARGLGIILVVIGHALGGLIDSKLGANQDIFRQLFFSIYTFHMPLFFLLSGLMVTKRLEKGQEVFLRGLIPSIVWPYFLWSIIQFTIIYGLGTLVNRPAESYWPVIVSLPWNTVSQFWFLYALFWMHILSVLLVPRLGREGFVLLALALKSLALILILPVPVKLVCNHLFFYAVGVWLATGGLETLIIKRGPWLKSVGVPLIAVATIGATLLAVPRYGADIPLLLAGSPEIANLAWRFPAMAAAIMGVAAVVAIASLPRIAGSRILLWLGRMTMPIFVLHVMFLAGTRIVLMRLDLVSNPALLLAISVAAGLIGPLIVERVTRALGLNRWIGFQ